MQVVLEKTWGQGIKGLLRISNAEETNTIVIAICTDWQKGVKTNSFDEDNSQLAPLFKFWDIRFDEPTTAASILSFLFGNISAVFQENELTN